MLIEGASSGSFYTENRLGGSEDLRALANFMTVFARIVVHDSEVMVYDTKGSLAFVLYGKLLRNLSGRDRFVNLMAENDAITYMVGHTPSGSKEEAFADIVFEKREDGGIDVGTQTEDRYNFIVMDLDTVFMLVRACEIALSGFKRYVCTDDYWTIHAEVDGYKIAVCGKNIEVISRVGNRLTIPRDKSDTWAEIMMGVDELSDCLEGSFRRQTENITITRVTKDIVQVSLGKNDNIVKYRFTFGLCVVLEGLIDNVWLFEDRKTREALMIDDDEDEDDLMEGGMS